MITNQLVATVLLAVLWGAIAWVVICGVPLALKRIFPEDAARDAEWRQTATRGQFWRSLILQVAIMLLVGWVFARCIGWRGFFHA